jgi:hypothetical protein
VSIGFIKGLLKLVAMLKKLILDMQKFFETFQTLQQVLSIDIK